MSQLDSRKQLLIDEFVALSEGKDSKEILPLILALSNKASQCGIKFSRADADIILEQFKDSLTPEEKNILPQLISVMNKNLS